MKKKRDLMAEFREGFVVLADQRTGKRALRTHVVQTKAAPKMSAKELSALRERMNLSRALFAKYLRTNVRTLENWEQGREAQRTGSTIDQDGRTISRYGGEIGEDLTPPPVDRT